MFRKTKNRTKLRQRVRSEDDDDGLVNTSSNSEAATSSVTTELSADSVGNENLKKLNTGNENRVEDKSEQHTAIIKPKSNSLLSFDDVEGDDVVDFKLKKKDRRLKHLEKMSKRAKEMNSNNYDNVVVKKEVEKNSVYTNNGYETITSIKKETTSYAADTDEDPIRNKFPSTFSQIPDAQAVYEARKKRERMRLMGDDNLMPLDDVQRFKDKSVARARLVREDDNDISDEDDERGRFYSSKNVIDSEEERIRNNRSDFLAVEQGDDNDLSDDEVSRWESEQIRKGVSFHKVERMEYERARMAEAMQAMIGTFSHVTENSEQLPMEMDIDVPDSDALDAPRGRISGQGSAVTLEEVLSKLRIRIKESDEVLNAREAELTTIEENIKENKESIANLESEKPKLSERFHMYQQVRGYLKDLLECISAKIEEINSAESQMAAIVNGRAQKFRKRRRQDVHDTYDECSAAAAGKQQTFVRSAEIIQRAAEREARRARRRRLREDTLEGISHEEGLSTDEEETNSEIVARQQAITDIQQTASTVFVDALDEYCNVGKIIARFIDWLAVDETSFTDAYIQLFIPKILSPFIRLEMLSWNPLEILIYAAKLMEEKNIAAMDIYLLSEHDDCPIQKMQWYQQLLLCTANNTNVDSENPVIVSLIPLCIEKVVLNIVTDMVVEQWDPLSEKQCRRLGLLLDSLVDECPLLVSSSPSVQRLLKSLRQRIQESIDEDLFIPIYSKQAIENVATGCKAFLDRQFWTAIKLVRCLRYFVNILSPECLDALIIEGVANRSWSLALQCSVSNDSSMVRKCRAVLKLISSEHWERYSSTTLRSLSSTLSRVAESLKPKYRDFSRELKKAIGVE